MFIHQGFYFWNILPTCISLHSKIFFMKQATKKQVVFIARSMMWSLLLYVVMMLVFNWDDVSKTIKGNNAITIVTDTLRGSQSQGTDGQGAAPTSISLNAGVLNNIITLLKDISGIAGKLPVQ